MDWIEISTDRKQAAKEKSRAKDLRKKDWWKNLVGAGVCHYCKGKFPPGELTMDHVVPLSRGGRSVRGNVVPCCKNCNNDKKYLTPAEIILRELESKKNTESSDLSDE